VPLKKVEVLKDLRKAEREQKRKLKQLVKFLKDNSDKMFSEDELRSMGLEPDTYFSISPFTWHRVRCVWVGSKRYYYYEDRLGDALFSGMLLGVVGGIAGIIASAITGSESVGNLVGGLLTALLLLIVLIYNYVLFFRGVKTPERGG